MQHTHTHTNKYTHKQTHTHKQTNTHKQTHTHKQTNTHTHTHTHLHFAKKRSSLRIARAFSPNKTILRRPHNENMLIYLCVCLCVPVYMLEIHMNICGCMYVSVCMYVCMYVCSAFFFCFSQKYQVGEFLTR